jgi:hypothetical protein
MHSSNLLDEILEQYNPTGPVDVPPTNPPVEFEEIKKYLLFERFKKLKIKFEVADLDRSDDQVRQISEFFNLILVFFSSFSYVDLVKLFNRLIDIISSCINVKVEKETVVPPPAPEIPAEAASTTADADAEAEAAEETP